MPAAVECTVCFYQGGMEFPLTEVFENRDLPGVDVGPYAEVLGGLHHLASGAVV